MSEINSEYYKKFISQNKSEQLCEELLGHLNGYILKDNNSNLRETYDELIMITGKLKSIGQEQLLNIINFDDANHEKSKLDLALLNLINELPSYFFDFMNGGDINLASSNDIRKNIDEYHKDSEFEYDAFFSYATSDYEQAKKICEELRGYGLTIFLSGEALKSTIGSSFFEKIEKAVKSSQHFILLSSVESMNSEWVKTEYETFYNEFFIPSKGKRRFLIAKGGNYNHDDVPTLLRRLQIANNPKEIIDTVLMDKSSKSEELGDQILDSIDEKQDDIDDVQMEGQEEILQNEIDQKDAEQKEIKHEEDKTIDNTLEDESPIIIGAKSTLADFLTSKKVKYLLIGLGLVILIITGIKILREDPDTMIDAKDKVEVMVDEAKEDDGSNVTTSSSKYQGIAKFGNDWIGGEIEAKMFKAENNLSISISDCLNNCNCKIQSFKITRMAPRSDAESINVSGSQIDAETAALINKAKPGDRYFFSDIKYICNGSSYKANSLFFKIRYEGNRPITMEANEDAYLGFKKLRKKNTSIISTGEFKSLESLSAIKTNCVNECSCTINEFTLILIPKRNEAKIVKVSGSKFDQKAKELQAKARNGDILIINDVKGSCNNKKQNFTGLFYSLR